MLLVSLPLCLYLSCPHSPFTSVSPVVYRAIMTSLHPIAYTVHTATDGRGPVRVLDKEVYSTRPQSPCLPPSRSPSLACHRRDRLGEAATQRRKFGSNEHVITRLDGWIESLPSSILAPRLCGCWTLVPSLPPHRLHSEQLAR